MRSTPTILDSLQLPLLAVSGAVFLGVLGRKGMLPGRDLVLGVTFSAGLLLMAIFGLPAMRFFLRSKNGRQQLSRAE